MQWWLLKHTIWTLPLCVCKCWGYVHLYTQPQRYLRMMFHKLCCSWLIDYFWLLLLLLQLLIWKGNILLHSNYVYDLWLVTYNDYEIYTRVLKKIWWTFDLRFVFIIYEKTCFYLTDTRFQYIHCIVVTKCWGNARGLSVCIHWILYHVCKYVILLPFCQEVCLLEFFALLD